MSLFRRKFVDERVENLENQIYKECFSLAITLCLVVILLKRFYFGIALSELWAEYLIMLVPLLYFMVRYMQKGLYRDEVELYNRKSPISMQQKLLYFGLGSVVVVATFFAARSAYLYGEGVTRLTNFFVTFLASLMIYVPVALIVVLVSIVAARKQAEEEQD